MHFKNARNASVYAVFRAFFTQSLAKLRIQIFEVYNITQLKKELGYIFVVRLAEHICRRIRWMYFSFRGRVLPP